MVQDQIRHRSDSRDQHHNENDRTDNKPISQALRNQPWPPPAAGRPAYAVNAHHGTDETSIVGDKLSEPAPRRDGTQSITTLIPSVRAAMPNSDERRS